MLASGWCRIIILCLQSLLGKASAVFKQQK
ncbi:hypothetical protein PSTT_09286 [Puccinia striiformis]|uniref:Uncharacterized protein n=1 Tax=Puccinia striiformis TaxID=27350 RepID=A0A2S4V910_9BASI|nr:hypothetical protein PSTT_09286 [Puccinia striiformis]